MTGEISIVRPMSAPRRTLWRACTTTAGLEGWYADEVTGVLAPGGRVHLAWPGLGAELDLTVVDWAPEERLVFSDARTEVELSLDGQGVALTHRGLGRADVPGFQSSWQLGLSLLSHGIETHDGAPRRPVWFSRSARVRADLVHLCVTEPVALAAWLGSPRGRFVDGSEYALDLADGGKMSGRVLSLFEGRDIALSFREDNDSVIAIRTLPSPKSADERVVALCWSRFGPPRSAEAHVERMLSTAFDRLLTLLRRSGAA